MSEFKPDYQRLNAILIKYGEETVAEMVQILDSKGSKRLQSKISKAVIEDIEYCKLVISMPSYGVWADAGRGAGVMPPYDNIKDWADSRGIPETAVFPIMKKIGQFGTKESAKDFLKVFYLNFDVFHDEINEAVTADYIQVLRQAIQHN